MGGGGSWNPVNIIEDTFSSAGDLLASVDPGPAIGGALAEVDDFVNDEIPGGWVLPAAVAVAVTTGYMDPTLLSAAGGEGAAAAGMGDVFAGYSATGSAAGTAGGTVGAGAGALGTGGGMLSSLGLGAEASAPFTAAPGLDAGLFTLTDAAAPAFSYVNPEFMGPTYSELGYTGLEAGQMGPTYGELGYTGYEEFVPTYPGDAQYEIQDLQEQARSTDVKPGSPTSWDTGDSLIPQDVKDALSAANKARQVYNLLSGVGGGMAARNVPGLNQYTTPTTAAGTQNIGIPNLTAGIVRGQPIDLNIDQFNAPLAPINAAEGGYIQNYAEAGEVDSYTDTNYQDTVAGLAKLRPNLMRGKSDFGLQKYWNQPSSQYAEGGEVEHNPEFFSEGGLQNRYVKGDGDGTSDDVPAMLANGEFVIPADVVSSLGNGSNDSGAHLLDEFLQVVREHKRNADARELPPDSKGPLGYLLEAKRKAR